ncbi:cytochrome c oxidase copper chaperone [Drosophila innubila]|uniref:cytochrome c oxidase copper chaperone n=1 Tax=Drosophila innubila TaxID=198719 RepID=UPI00148DD0D5|nr:cytochrome c oxidase copper chaperone [Drosophila innubila]XP_034489530.1 cytochrome c oxidase copper chaperone [Drosophila innubila]
MGSDSSKAVGVVETAAVPATAAAKVTDAAAAGEKPKCKACCACPETKRARDQCIVENGEENCTKLIEAHKQCMRDAGFKI